ncbi:hypothetical protein [Sphingosinicella humi]|uniref:Uncharacterized protein n=1 Tax=Allosphingosinicella humi TaxID=2068657 RepID=A0A2U2J1F8_9SPHN|nr:hypothetical protein [Sphingosinicella humi]PWG02152.1 hypothetical protein DF286_04170 [Sphingosinicella humi]
MLTLLTAWLGLGLLALQLPAPAPAPTSLSAPASLSEAPPLAIAPRAALADVRDTGRLASLRGTHSQDDQPGFDGAGGLGSAPIVQLPQAYAAKPFGFDTQIPPRQRPWQGVRARAPPSIA